MFKSNKNLTSVDLSIISALLFGAGCYTSSASAVDYSVVAGSQVVLVTVNSPMAPTNITGGNIVIQANNFISTPVLGGFSLSKGTCVSQSDITQIDGWNGVSINPAGIIAGFTGSISGGIAKVGNALNSRDSTTFTGGILLDSRGYSIAIGDVQQEYADVLCASFFGPYDRNSLGDPNSESLGNKLATAEGYLWIYVSKDTPIGTYPLDGVFLSQGIGRGSYASIDITQAGDTLTVIPPPCTIATETTIRFETYSSAGMKVNAPISYQCGEVQSSTILDAYLTTTAIGSPATATELALTSSGGNPGGRVRGYVGEGVDTDNVNCLDSANSLSFDGAFNTRLAPVNNGLTLQVPLVWQLCPQGNEEPGLATGSVLLDIGYR